MKNKLNSKKIIILIIILIIIVCAAAFLLFFAFPKEKEKKQKKEYPIKNLVNSSDKLKKEHCLEDVCIKNLEIGFLAAENKENEMSVITAIITNKASETRNTCVKLKFYQTDKTKTKDFSVCAFDLEPNKELDIETQHSEEENNLIYSEDYILEHLTPEEEQEILSTKESE